MHRGSILDPFWLNVFIHGSGKDGNGRLGTFAVDRNIEVLINITGDRISIQKIHRLNNMSDLTRKKT